MPSLQKAAAPLLLALLLVSSGCMGFFSGPVTFEATPADVGSGAQEETGYTLERAETMNVSREFSAAGQSKEVTAVNYLREYKRKADLGPLGERELARFVVLSTPEVKVGPKTFNPIGEMSNKQLALQLQSSYDSIENIETVSSRNVTVLGKSTEVTKFKATAKTNGGTSVDVYLHVTKVNHEEDFVVAIAVHPQQLDEQQRIDTLLAGIEHPADG